jgi:hypothetical protein
MTTGLSTIKTIIQNNYPSFMGAYDIYNTRINQVLKDIDNYKALFKKISAHNITEFTLEGPYIQIEIDGVIQFVTGILKRTSSEDFYPYVPKDLSDYDNKYCIYWYKYQNGYSDENDPIGMLDWKMITEEDVLNSTIKNIGLPTLNADGTYPPKVMATDPNVILRLMLPITNRQEKYKAILFYNHVKYESNEITFVNERTPADEALKNNITIEHGSNSYDSYAKYGIDNTLIDATDYNRPRKLKVRYLNELGEINDDKLIGASIYWYIPNNAT